MIFNCKILNLNCKWSFFTCAARHLCVTLCAASSVEKAFTGNGGNKEAAHAVGKLIAERAAEKGITDVVFDRGGYIFHGRVKELADGAREGGLNF